MNLSPSEPPPVHRRSAWKSIRHAYARIPVGERVNTLSHGLGWLLSCVGSLVLISQAARRDGWRLLGCVIFAVTLISVYAASTLSHYFAQREWRIFYRKLDQGCIFLLIVGTYTPFSFTYLRSGVWWLFLAVMWMIAIAGFISKVGFTHRVEGVSIWLYIILGWLPILPTYELVSRVPQMALLWMLAGGLSYTVGTLFLIMDWQRYHFHAIWHAWVMVGSTLHFCAIWTFVAMRPI